MVNNNNSVNKINPDLARERSKCTFNVEELTTFIDGSSENTKTRRERENFFLKSITQPKVPLEYLSHQERYDELMRMSVELYTSAREYSMEHGNPYEVYRHILGATLGPALTPDGNPLTLHFIMFLATIMGQGNDEQNVEWTTKAAGIQIIGTYAQTELGHGTFIRGLETTATYDETTEEFVLNSPTLTSYKWWPGGLGHASNYAIVMAQLYTKGICHGIHAFIVQLRDEDTHVPLKGIKIGEIGAKLAMNANNNGYLGLEHVRIPRKQMLMKHSQVLKDGTYQKAPNSKLTYSTMILMRVVIVENAADYLKRAVVIATRYSAVRRQSKLKETEPELQILDFVTQQYRIFPLIATVFAFHATAKWVWELFTNIEREILEGELTRLPELHAIACCLKAVSTTDCAQGVETCRFTCGGHGFMMSSSLPTTYGIATAACTYEGENTVMLLQTARYLMKSYQGFLQGKKLTPTLVYIEKFKGRATPSFQPRVEWIISALENVAARQIETAHGNIMHRTQNGVDYEHAWNQTSIELVSVAEMHCLVNVVTIFYEHVKSSKENLSKELALVMEQLLELYAVSTALKYSGKLLQFTNTTGHDVSELQRWLEDILAAIRPNAVGIVDGFDLSDDILRSTLGAYDGNVYERLYEEAQKSPMNQDQENKTFHKYLKPFLKSNM